MGWQRLPSPPPRRGARTGVARAAVVTFVCLSCASRCCHRSHCAALCASVPGCAVITLYCVTDHTVQRSAPVCGAAPCCCVILSSCVTLCCVSQITLCSALRRCAGLSRAVVLSQITLCSALRQCAVLRRAIVTLTSRVVTDHTVQRSAPVYRTAPFRCVI
ncbi:hypothetical protein NDU88_007763 [Pleurodeles waltl]|uniref:Secreted protein n=1 Tax=Pleurodeles waltl TaxID=8319 RepID=A0AAV7U2H3_PLEWA|nr:hypothetical protein NDU88_007763 [Pleurodeles waltl]